MAYVCVYIINKMDYLDSLELLNYCDITNIIKCINIFNQDKLNLIIFVEILV